MYRQGFAVIALATLLPAAGCLSQNLPEAVDLDDAASLAAVPWSLLFPEGCREAGFVAPYNMNEGDTIADAFVRADVQDEIGSPLIRSPGAKTTEAVTGNWHQGFYCPTAVRDGQVVQDFLWGYVGQWIEPPAWDTGGADVHVHLTGFGMQDGALRDSALPLTMMDITQTTEASLTEFPGGTVQIYFRDEPKGTYEVHGPIQPVRDVEPRTIRFWWYVPTDGSRSEIGHVHDDPLNVGQPADQHAAKMEGMTFHPAWVDLHTGGGTQRLSVDAAAAASHNDEDAHGGAVFWLPEMAVVYEHKSLSMELGHVVKDVTLETFYWH